MKIKTWLLVSYLIVMILPLVAAYVLFLWINAYHQEKNVEEYFEKWVELQKIIEVIDTPEMFQLGRTYEELNKLTGAHIEINLYLKEGFLLYTSNPIKTQIDTIASTDKLYKNLYEFEKDYYAYTYRSPVLQGKDIIGIYEVKLARNEWVKGVSDRTWLVIGIFVLFFVAIFTIVAFLVNRKLNKPLRLLMKQMNAFAERNEVSPIYEVNDEIGELAKSFDEMRLQIITAKQKLIEEQGEKEYMIASISHDLKTPLTSIRTYAEALVGTIPNEEKISEYSQVIVDKSNYMKHMLDDLLMYTLLQTPTYEMDLIEVEGEEFFDMLISDYESLCMEKGISLELLCTVEGLYLVNPKQMLRVVDNLMSNAIKHSDSKDHILLATIHSKHLPLSIMPFVKPLLTKQEGMYLIVQNSGEGIEQTELENVFKPLYQVDSARTKNRGSGTGLGLSITKQIIEKHGGTVEIASDKQVGTCVICWLPSINKGE
ncbi:HAMP domain-containing sensor histidine kinase [Cytobacillus praedii]|uniref:sensor histidine kinase n=1 Tax=Cytobacillus praedii TaxID=1742358 RepID=UPI002E1D0B8D|nr:HAMP domain-containing sensor histidine kinase [Cytobacillus praedii]